MNTRSDVWFVTGCSRGLGRALAEEILAQGHYLVATARNPADLADLQRQHPDRIMLAALDLCDQSQIAAATASAIDRFGRIDVVVNNAGYSQLGAIEEVGDRDARAQFDTNYFGPVALIRAVLPSMRRARKGCLVNISSVGGFAALAGCGQYSATKFALEGLSEALAQEVAPLGIKVMLVEPNGFRTDFVSTNSMRIALPAITEYDATRGETLRRFAVVNGRQPNDPRRGAQAIIRAVEADHSPFRLVLGRGGVARVREKLSFVEGELAAWTDLSGFVAYDQAAS